MRKMFLTFIGIIIGLSSFSQKMDFLSILRDVAVAMQDRQLTYQNVLSEAIIVNSTSNAGLSGGHDRQVIKLNIPKDAVRWYYRITVLDKVSSFSYPPNETLAYQLINRKEIGNLVNNNIPINVYFMNASGEVNNFMLNRPFKQFAQYSVQNANSYYAASNLVDENLYMGIQNTSLLNGAKVIVEVVILTPKVTFNPLVTYQSVKQIKDAKELLDLGVINKKSYDSIAQLYSPKLTRQEALDMLKDAKAKLDAGTMTQAEYDNLKNILSPTILTKQ